MTLAENCIARLDYALGRVGQSVVLQRLVTDETGAQIPTYQANCRASVRAHQPQGIDPMTAGEARSSMFVISPTDLARELWPGLPRKDDRVLYQAGERVANIEIVSPIYVDDVLVRVDLEARE